MPLEEHICLFKRQTRFKYLDNLLIQDNNDLKTEVIIRIQKGNKFFYWSDWKNTELKIYMQKILKVDNDAVLYDFDTPGIQ